MQINRKFKVTQFHPKGDQSQAINKLVGGLKNRETHQVLLGVTGSGKTYTMAKVIEKMNRPALVLAHNKTLGDMQRMQISEVQGHFLQLITTITISLKPTLLQQILILRRNLQ